MAWCPWRSREQDSDTRVIPRRGAYAPVHPNAAAVAGMALSKIKHFIFRDLRRVKGYLDPADALVFLSLLEGQQRSKLSGGLAEIGIYYGRSFFLLKKLAKDGEQVLGIDTFDIGNDCAGPSRQMRDFLSYGKSIRVPTEAELIIAADSTTLSVSDIVSRIGPVRFFSVDGGHMLHHFQSDCRLASESLAEFGVIAFDDSFNPEWPEVTVGLIDFLRANPASYSLFCVTNKKAYVCRNAYLLFYRDLIWNSPHLKAFVRADVSILGKSAVRVHHPIGRRIFYELLARSGAGALYALAYAS